jgi:hexosaminidase
MTRCARFSPLVFAVAAIAACGGAPPNVTPAPATPPSATLRPVDISPHLVPQPASLTVGTGAPFTFTATSSIVVDPAVGQVQQIADMFAAIVRQATGFPLPVTTGTGMTPAGSVRLRLALDRSALGDEGYELSVTADSVLLVAHSQAGLFRGLQTFRQLLPPAIESHIGRNRQEWVAPAVTIADAPRFAWRGAMLDVARHFFTVDEVKQFIDILALYKINVLHLHLTDDQGWRLQINSRPKLTTVGGVMEIGNAGGGFFTQQDYLDIVRYADARFILVVPEIEMPGHSSAALMSYPETTCGMKDGKEVYPGTFCPDKPETWALIDDVIREVAAITPGPYIHIGGDEVATLTDSTYVAFIERAQGVVTKHGKRMIGWEEIIKARLLPATIAQQWKSDSVKGALTYGSKLILSPATKIYLDMRYTPATELGLAWAAHVEVRDAYDWNPATIMPGVVESNILGIEAPLWAETIRNLTAAEYLAMPRLPAAAEVAWTPQSARDWESFRTRIAAHAARWRYLGINYYPSPQIPW